MAAMATCNRCRVRMPVREVFTMDEILRLAQAGDIIGKMLVAPGRCLCGGDLESYVSAREVFTPPEDPGTD